MTPTHLDREDLERVLDMVRYLYAAPTPELFPHAMLDRIRDLVVCDSATYNEVDPKHGRAVGIWNPDPLPVHPDRDVVALLTRFGELAAEHPVIRRASVEGDGSAGAIADYLSTAEFHETSLYRDVYRWMYVEHQLAITLPTVVPRVVGIALSRGDVRHPFDRRDHAVLNVLRPHLMQAYQRASDAAQVQRLLAASSRAFASTGALVVVLDGPEPVELTEGALVELFRYFGRPGPTDPLPARVRRWLDQQTTATVASGSADAHALLRPIQAEMSGTIATMRLIPSDDAPALMLTLAATERGADLTPLGLTNRETEVLRFVADGLTNERIARRMRISAATVKKHLENCYRKLGVSNRAAAVSISHDLLAHDAAHPATTRPDPF